MKKLIVTVNGKKFAVEVEELVSTGSAASPEAIPNASANVSSGGAVVASPLAGKIVELKVSVGDSVSEGDTLAVLEAMKMNTLVSASTNGTVASISVGSGDMVEEGQALLSIR